MYLGISVAPSKSTVFGRYEFGNSFGGFQKVCSPQTWLCGFADLSQWGCSSLGVLPYHVMRRPVHGRIYSHVAPSFLLNINIRHSPFPKTFEFIAMAALPVPPKGVSSFWLKIPRKRYHVCSCLVQKYYEDLTMSALRHRNITKVKIRPLLSLSL